MPPSRGNSKKEAGQQRKAEQKLQKQQQEAARLAQLQEEEWKKGANIKGAQRAESAGTSVWMCEMGIVVACGLTMIPLLLYLSTQG